MRELRTVPVRHHTSHSHPLSQPAACIKR